MYINIGTICLRMRRLVEYSMSNFILYSSKTAPEILPNGTLYYLGNNIAVAKKPRFLSPAPLLRLPVSCFQKSREL